MKVESGFTRKFFVVRRALDACLLENGRNGRRERIVRNEGLAGGRKGTMGFMLLLRISRGNDLGKSCIIALTARHVIGIHHRPGSQLWLDRH